MATQFDPATAPVSVFYPSSPAAATRLKQATIFTRLGIIATPDVVKQAIETTTGLSNTFCLGPLQRHLGLRHQEGGTYYTCQDRSANAGRQRSES